MPIDLIYFEFLVLAIYDMRNVFASRFIDWGRTYFAGLGVPKNAS